MRVRNGRLKEILDDSFWRRNPSLKPSLNSIKGKLDEKILDLQKGTELVLDYGFGPERIEHEFHAHAFPSALKCRKSTGHSLSFNT